MTSEEFHTLYWKYAPRLLKGCLKLFPREAEDVVQQVFQQVWDKKIQAENYDRYLFIMACNIVRNMRRHESKTQGVYRQFLIDQEGLNASYDLPRIDKLPSQQRRVIELKLQGYDHHADIAKIMGISASTVNNHVTTAYATIRKFEHAS